MAHDGCYITQHFICIPPSRTLLAFQQFFLVSCVPTIFFFIEYSTLHFFPSSEKYPFLDLTSFSVISFQPISLLSFTQNSSTNKGAYVCCLRFHSPQLASAAFRTASDSFPSYGFQDTTLMVFFLLISLAALSHLLLPVSQC